MDVMEKLVELIAKAKTMYADDYTDHTEDEYIAETLLDNFITVWDGKPIEAFLHPVDAYKGLKAKYLVFKADTGERVDNCFILRPDKDIAAVEALRAYAKVTDNETLAKDIYNWVGNGVTVQEWISVDDRLPENDVMVIGYTPCDGFMFVGYYHQEPKYDWEVWRIVTAMRSTKVMKKKVTHWMPMPQPPKGE